MRVGIFGGSFNPVHNGHLKLAREALSELNLDRLFFVPSCITPLKAKEGLLPGALRVKLLKTALKGKVPFSVSLCEMRRRGLSFTVDTLKYFRRKFGRNTVLYFLAGADTLRDIRRWKSPKEIFRLCRFVVMTRPRFSLAGVPDPVVHLPFDALDISSSDIRERLSHKKRIGHLVPPGCERILINYFKRAVLNG